MEGFGEGGFERHFAEVAFCSHDVLKGSADLDTARAGCSVLEVFKARASRIVEENAPSSLLLVVDSDHGNHKPTAHRARKVSGHHPANFVQLAIKA